MEKRYDLIQTSEFLGIKVRTVREWIRNGKLKATKLHGGRKWTVTESEIRRLQEGDQKHENID